MARRKITPGDWLKGAGRSIMAGQAMNPLTTQKYINAAHDERVASQLGRTAIGESDLSDMARRAFRDAQQQKGRDLQYKQDGIIVKVKNGYSRRVDSYTTDVILIDPGRKGEHLHIVFDERGTITHNKWTRDH